MTTTRINNRHTIRRPALRWYSWAVVSSSAADEVFWATEVMLLSILSVHEQWPHTQISPYILIAVWLSLPRCQVRRTDQTPLLRHYSPQIPKNIIQLVYPRFNLSNLCLSLRNYRLLEFELLHRHPLFLLLLLRLQLLAPGNTIQLDRAALLWRVVYFLCQLVHAPTLHLDVAALSFGRETLYALERLEGGCVFP